MATCSLSPGLEAVRASAAARRVCSRMVRLRRSPMKRIRTPLPCSSAISRSSASTNRFIRLPTSSAGRRQFSLEKAKSVSASIPRREHSEMTSRTGSRPALWPAVRLWPRAAAADWSYPPPSHLHDLFLLGGQQRFDIGNVLVGELLHLGLGAPLVILRHELLLEHLLDVVHDIAAHVAHGDARVLGVVPQHLGDLAPPLLGKRWHGNTDHGAGRHGGEAEIRFEDRLLDRL